MPVDVLSKAVEAGLLFHGILVMVTQGMFGRLKKHSIAANKLTFMAGCGIRGLIDHYLLVINIKYIITKKLMFSLNYMLNFSEITSTWLS